MTKLKTRKALLKRIKITGKGKILRRPVHQGHFNAKDSGNKTRSKRKKEIFSAVDTKMVRNVLPNI